ncbi:MAG: glycosyltransferase [Elusimicrobiota bacterium]
MTGLNYFRNKNLLNLYAIEKHEYWKFLVENLKPYFNQCHTFNFIDYSRKYGLKNTEDYIRKFVKEKNIDIVLPFFFASDFELTPQFYKSLQNTSNVVFWFFDDDSFIDVITKYYAQVGSAVLNIDYLPLFYYKRLGINAIYAPETQNKKDFYPISVPKDIDVSFVGDCTKSDRMIYLNFLEAKGIKLETFGFGSKNGYAARSELPRIYSRSKISLNFTRVDELTWMTEDDPLLNRVRQTKGHFAQVAMTKTFCLSEYAPGLPVRLEIGKDIVTFFNKEELFEKVKYYLENTAERNDIAENGYKKAMKYFEAGVEFPRILNELGSILSSPDSMKLAPNEGVIYLSDSFKAKSVNGLAFSMSVLIAHLKIKNAIELLIRATSYGFPAFMKGFHKGVFRAFMVFFHKLTNRYSQIYKR